MKALNATVVSGFRVFADLLNMGRIIYISTQNAAPSGGVKVLYQQVAALREMGFDACIGHPVDGYRPDWFPTDVPIIYYLKGMRVAPDDVVVIPETGKNTMRLFSDVRCRKLIFCQNHFGIHQGLGSTAHWRDAGVSGAFACSELVARWVERLMRMGPVPVIGPAIEDQFFDVRADRRLQIAFMPRKRAADAPHIRRLLCLLHPEFAAVPWVPLANASLAEVAGKLAGSAVFLSLSHREGLGLPPLEAMAAGCLVSGFHGIGGQDYATVENGFWAAEDDLFECAAQLGAALTCYQREPAESIDRRRAAGMQTARRYTAGPMRKALESFWKPLVSRTMLD